MRIIVHRALLLFLCNCSLGAVDDPTGGLAPQDDEGYRGGGPTSCTSTWLGSNPNWATADFSYVSSARYDFTPAVYNLLDYDLTTLWTSGAGQVTNQWIVFDFKGPAPLDGFQAAIPADDTVSELAYGSAKDLVLQSGPSAGGPWTDVAYASLTYQDGVQSFTFAQTTSQYWRLFIADNYGNPNGITLAEVGFSACY